MKTNRNRALAWLLAVLMTGAMFACMFAFLDVRYAVNDDAATLHMFQGYMSGEPARFHIYLHGLLVWPLHLLGRIAPTVAWYSYLQLALLFVSCTVMAKSIMQCFLKRGCRLWTGAMVAAAVLGCLCLRWSTVITYTQTAALLGAAAVLQMMSIEHDSPKKVIRGMMGALALVVLAYSLRQLTALPILAVCGLVFVYLFFEEYGFGQKAKRCAKPMLVSLLIVAVVMGGMAGVRELEIALNGQRDHLAWQQARIALLDYHDVKQLPQEAIEAAGWSPAVYEMLTEWGFLDASVTTESFRHALEVVEGMDTRTFGQRLSDAWTTVVSGLQSYPEDVRCLGLAAVVLALCLIGAVCRKENRGRLLLMVLAVTGAFAAMILYLALKGRLPARALLMAALPCAAALLGLLPACLPKGRSAVSAVLCAAYAVFCLWTIVPGMLYDEEAELALGSAMMDLEEYASWNEDCLFIYDHTMAGVDNRLFPEYWDAVPSNLTFWGGWTSRSQQNAALFERFGLDADNFDPAAFVNENVFIASGRIDPPPQLVLNWLREKLGDNVQCEYWSEYGTVYIFSFYQE